MPRSQRNYELKRRKNPTRWGGGYRSVAYIREYPPRHRVCSEENHIMGPTILHTEYILSYFRTKVVEIAQYLWFFTAKPSYATTSRLLVSEYRPIIQRLFKTPMQNFPTQSLVVGTSWTTITFGERPRPLFGVTGLQCLTVFFLNYMHSINLLFIISIFAVSCTTLPRVCKTLAFF